MDIIVCIKAVCMSPVRFSLSGGRIDPGSRTLVMNEADEYALGEALALRNEHGGRVTAITVGRLSSQDVLYVAKAKGADRAIRVDAEPVGGQAVAGALASAIRNLNFDLVLTGVESFDNMGGQTGIFLAEKLGLPFAYSVVGIEPRPGLVRVRKELGGGTYQILDIEAPALLCVQTGIRPLKYTPPARLLNARKESLESVSLGAADGVQEPPGSPRVTTLFRPERASRATVLEGDPAEVAATLVEKILEVR